MKLVMANGCFDILHAGHVGYLKAAAELGNYLIVALTLDRHVNKPGRPVHSWTDRRDTLVALRCVTQVLPSETGADAIRKYKPNIFAKGVDYTLDTLPDDVIAACKEVGAKIVFVGPPKRDIRKLIAEAG